MSTLITETWSGDFCEERILVASDRATFALRRFASPSTLRRARRCLSLELHRQEGQGRMDPDMKSAAETTCGFGWFRNRLNK